MASRREFPPTRRRIRPVPIKPSLSRECRVSSREDAIPSRILSFRGRKLWKYWQRIRIGRDVLFAIFVSPFLASKRNDSDPETYVCIYVYIREENCFIDEALESNNWRVGTERENRIKIFGTSIDVHASIKSGDCAVVSKHEFPINKGDRSRRVVQPVELSPRANENGFYVILISHGKWKPLKYRSRHSRNFFA